MFLLKKNLRKTKKLKFFENRSSLHYGHRCEPGNVALVRASFSDEWYTSLGILFYFCQKNMQFIEGYLKLVIAS